MDSVFQKKTRRSRFRPPGQRDRRSSLDSSDSKPMQIPVNLHDIGQERVRSVRVNIVVEKIFHGLESFANTKVSEVLHDLPRGLHLVRVHQKIDVRGRPADRIRIDAQGKGGPLEDDGSNPLLPESADDCFYLRIQLVCSGRVPEIGFSRLPNEIVRRPAIPGPIRVFRWSKGSTY